MCPDGSLASIHGCPQRQQARPKIPRGATACGAGYCSAGMRCSSKGKCIANDAVECGDSVCSAGNQCTKDGCLPQGASLCGSGYCSAGLTCVRDQCALVQKQPSAFVRILSGLGDWSSSQGIKVSGNQTVSSVLQQRDLKVAPSAFRVEKLLSDPYSTANPVLPSQGASSSDPFARSVNTPSVQAQTPTASSTPSQGIQTPQNTSGGCGPGMREASRGNFIYCELWSPSPP